MIDKKLLDLLGKSKKYIVFNVFFQWLSMICNIFMVLTLVRVLSDVMIGSTEYISGLKLSLIVLILGIVFRGIFRYLADTMSYKTTLGVKSEIRDKIYSKLLVLGPAYKDDIPTAEVVQLTIEGVEQLEIYYSKYIPQFFYSILAPLTLFVVLSRYSLKVSLILLLGVPLIPISIMIVAKFAKRLLDKYWSIYIGLGDSFLENLQGLTTLKIYEADEYKNKVMNEEAENFRKITMKVLAMQLNSITVMDLVAFGGAAIGMIFTILEYSKGRLELAPALGIILLSSEFFIPMRLLGSFFHVSMNGVSASKKIFKLLQMPEEENIKLEIDPVNMDIILEDLHFSYEEDREILKGINLMVPQGSFVSIVGESGSGKSTIASLVMGYGRDYKGSLTIGGQEISDISNSSIMKHCTYIGHDEYIFKGTVRENLLMGIPNGTTIIDEKMNEALKKVNLYDFMMSQQGLDTVLDEKGSNLSGGQKQRLALARGLLHDSEIYIFDEATSNIDVESENQIMKVLGQLKNQKTVVLISHRLHNVIGSDYIYVLAKGKVVEQGTHEELEKMNGIYHNIYHRQRSLENYGGELQYA